jgi:hypothetical protein
MQDPSRPVYVDSAIHRWRGQLWCHVFSPDLEALHAFMESIGSKREWFQDPDAMPSVSWPHYDANAKRRAAAIEAGATVLGRHQTVVMSRAVKNAWNGRYEDPLSGHRARGSPMLRKLEIWMEEQASRHEHSVRIHLIGK